MSRTTPLLLAALLLAGCASDIPLAIREPAPAPSATLSAVRATPEELSGRGVRWGGNVVAVRNRQSSTELELVARPLQSEGQPHASAESEGRFLARVDGFLDPAIYNGHLVTVAGRVVGVEQHPVGEYDYRFPVVQVQTLYLWPERQLPRYRPVGPWYYDPFWPPLRSPYYGDPFWDPFYPYWW